MRRRILFHLFLATLIVLCLPRRGPATPAQTTPAVEHIKQRNVDFNREIRPVLSDTCFSCHGPDEGTRQASLRLDVKEGKESAFVPRDAYRVITPGRSAESRLYQRISSRDDAVRMPPVWSGRSLTPQQVELIREWIDQGAEWATHWAFVPPKRVPVPGVKDRAWPRNPIDNFILARIERESLKPSPEADKVTLLRRVTLELTGLPPTRTEVDAFLADRSSDAYDKVVDRLLQSPHYGERMAMFWLDLARYADTHGYYLDGLREMWHWRDWVVDAFNQNMPFDQFTIDQLAGDLLPNATLEQKIATGFNRNHMINYEGGAIPEEYHTEYVVDRVEATSTAWMGLTMGCSRCHDHKYDPITQKDFYRFFAFFNNVPERGLDGLTGNAEPVVQIPSPDQKRQLDELSQKMAEVEEGMAEKEIARSQGEWEKTALSKMPHGPDQGIVAHYGFEGNLADTSGFHCDGKTRRGEVTFGMGAVGNAAEFNGETRVDLGNTGAFDWTDSFSLALWFSVSNDKSDMQAMNLLQKVDASKERRGYELSFDELVPIGDLKRGAHLLVRMIHRWPDESIQIKTKDRLVQSAWHHLVLNYDGSGKASGLKLYVDGKPQDVEVIKDGLMGSIQNGSSLEIGNKQVGNPYKGEIDDLRLYNRQLTAADIERLAIHEPIRAILSSFSGACAEMAKLAEKERLPKKDPLAEQAEDHKIAKVKNQCRLEQGKVRDYYLTWAATDYFKKLYAELLALKKRKSELDKAIPTSMVMKEMEEPRETFVLFRGDYRNKSEKVSPEVPSVLPPMPKDMPPSRLGLAKWLVSPSHPLTARVALNHYWQMYFGAGLVKTAENFGSQGEAPSHPELLDWLATEFVRTGWNVKGIQRLIVTSATYRQSSKASPELLEKDPDNRLLARGARFRMPAEVVRDNALAISGLLNQEIGGPSVFPYQPKGLWEEMAYGDVYSAQSYSPSQGKDLYRRTMYTFWKRTIPPAAPATFDAPDREKCTARRLLTNTPLQALVLMNDPTYIEAARALAQRTLIDADRDPTRRISYAFRLATCRDPAPKELQVLRELLDQELAHYRANQIAAFELLRVGESAYDRNFSVSELAAWTTVASAILSINETMTKE